LAQDGIRKLGNQCIPILKETPVENEAKGPRFAVSINLGNDAFVEDRDGEIAKILKDLAVDVAEGIVRVSGKVDLRDSNGGVVGTASYIATKDTEGPRETQPESEDPEDEELSVTKAMESADPFVNIGMIAQMITRDLTPGSGDAEIWAKPKTDEAGRVLAPKVDAKIRKSINDQLYDFSKQYWKSIPLSDIRGILNSNGLDFEDSIITGRDGRDTFDLTMGGHPVSNSMLVLSWHKMESGNWEINAYLS
jgi:hypothetical protein